MTSTAADIPESSGDVLVVFGITGDLARVMTFRSLYRLEARGLLSGRIGVTVDDSTLDPLVERASDLDQGTGETLDGAVSTGSPDACRTSPATSTTGDLRPRGVRHRRCGGAGLLLEIPPFLFGA